MYSVLVCAGLPRGFNHAVGCAEYGRFTDRIKICDGRAGGKGLFSDWEFAPRDATGICVYCNHCQPCPMGLNVGLINKYYDLALAGDELAKGHYQKLPIHADACAKCGHCESRCPLPCQTGDENGRNQWVF